MKLNMHERFCLAIFLIAVALYALTGCSLTGHRDTMQDCRALCGKPGATEYAKEFGPDTGAVKCGCRNSEGDKS